MREIDLFLLRSSCIMSGNTVIMYDEGAQLLIVGNNGVDIWYDDVKTYDIVEGVDCV